MLSTVANIKFTSSQHFSNVLYRIMNNLQKMLLEIYLKTYHQVGIPD